MGMHVLIADRNGEALEGAVAQLEAVAGGRSKVAGQACDVSDLEQVKALADRGYSPTPKASPMTLPFARAAQLAPTCWCPASSTPA